MAVLNLHDRAPAACVTSRVDGQVRAEERLNVGRGGGRASTVDGGHLGGLLQSPLQVSIDLRTAKQIVLNVTPTL